MNRRNFLKSGIFASTLLYVQSIFSGKVFAQVPKKGAVMIVAHMDDEVLWFLPWLHQVDKIIITSLPYTSAHLNILSKYVSQYDALWQFSRGITSFQEYKEKWLDPKVRQGFITDWHYDVMLRDIIADPEVTEIWTHNPWGEYGHLHHRQVSTMVRKLATEYGKDVWCPNMVVNFVAEGNPLATYEAVYLPGFKSCIGYFEANIFRRIRRFYLNEPVNQTFPINYWTWGGPYNHPHGNQEYFLAVSAGIDYTLKCDEIQRLVKSVPIFGK